MQAAVFVRFYKRIMQAAVFVRFYKCILQAAVFVRFYKCIMQAAWHKYNIYPLVVLCLFMSQT